MNTKEVMKKIDRKTKKFAVRLQSTRGISSSEVPQKFIAICNHGQATGLQTDKIQDILKNHLPKIHMPKYIAEKGESYSFLKFECANDAEETYMYCNGKVRVDGTGPPLYMIFVNDVPNSEIICKQEIPKGLTLLKNFISIEEESDLIQVFDWTEEIDGQTLKNRQVKHFGYEFRYGTNDVNVNSPLDKEIPEACKFLWSRLQKCGVDVKRPPDQLTVNKYLPGQGIPSHVDKHSPFGDTILALSLAGSVVMDWRHHGGGHLPLFLDRRSMLVMKEDARYDWQHGIQPRKWDPVLKRETITTTDNKQKVVTIITNDVLERDVRISLTFRWTRTGLCECVYRTLCDSVHEGSDIKEEVAAHLEELHVHQVYEKIAGHFSTTRHKPWPKVVEFMTNVPTGSVVLDLGCGNGKNILKRSDILQLACERSAGLLQECKSHVATTPGADCVRIDLLNTTLRDACVDVVICIAVIHHFSSKPRRLQALNTISRLLRTGGKALITVWAKDQTKSNYLDKTKCNNTSKLEETHVTVNGVNLPVHENRTQFQHTDLLVPWKLRNVSETDKLTNTASTFLRYYHVFEDNELSDLCREVIGLRVVSSFYEEGNWCVICTKE